jgi:2-hydroxychromene-2-carboxylate isomerase
MSESIRVAVDFKSPEAYLAVAPTRALEERLGLTFDWVAVSVAALTPPKPAAANEDRGTRHRRMRAEYRANDLRRYAAARGLDLGDVYRQPDTTTASLGLLWLRRWAPASVGDYVAGVFDRLWRDGADADLGFVERCLAGAARGFRAYAAGDGPRELEAVAAELTAAGVWSTPAYLVADDLFIGRQHLPMVEWLIGGRTGAPPI